MNEMERRIVRVESLPLAADAEIVRQRLRSLSNPRFSFAFPIPS
jgi:hypothetical protein